MSPVRVSIVGVIASLVLILVVLELVRGRRLKERYALLWLATGIVLLVLSSWRERAEHPRRLVRRHRLPAGCALRCRDPVLPPVLLHYSTVISQLTDENVDLAQRFALLEERLSRPAADELRDTVASFRHIDQSGLDLARARRWRCGASVARYSVAEPHLTRQAPAPVEQRGDGREGTGAARSTRTASGLVLRISASTSACSQRASAHPRVGDAPPAGPTVGLPAPEQDDRLVGDDEPARTGCALERFDGPRHLGRARERSFR